MLVAAAFGLAAEPAAAQAHLPSDRAALFAYLVRNPGDVPATLRYASLSNEAGDIEAAIGALERVLFFKPDEPNARLYLGILYGKLGSHDMARGYYQSVLQHPATPEPIKARATYLLGKAETKLSPHQWNSYVRTGIRWQSNANGEPDGDYTAYNPAIADWVDVTGNPESDWNGYLNTGFSYSYDFGNQRGDRFEASLTSYSTRQLDFDEYDYTSAELTFGPRFGIPTNHPTAVATIKPYLLFGGALLDKDEYFVSFGGGVTGTVPVGTWTLAPYADVVWREYSDDTSFFDPSDPNDFDGGTGPVTSAGIRLSSDPYAAQRFNLHLGYSRLAVDDAEIVPLPFTGYSYSEDYLSYDRFIAELRLPFDISLKGHQLLVTPLIGFRWTQYDEPDLFVQNPNDVVPVRREDKQFRVGLAADYAINDLAGVGTQIFYTKTDSNLSAYDTDNLSISFGPHFRF